MNVAYKPSAEEIKRLREATGAGISDVRNALIWAEGDYERAKARLGELGQAKAEQKAERAANEGDRVGDVNRTIRCEVRRWKFGLHGIGDRSTTGIDAHAARCGEGEPRRVVEDPKLLVVRWTFDPLGGTRFDAERRRPEARREACHVEDVRCALAARRLLCGCAACDE